jgi:hypothetical protein
MILLSTSVAALSFSGRLGSKDASEAVGLALESFRKRKG